MAYQDKIEKFKAWATSIGCPPSALPSNDALRSIYKSGSSQLLDTLQTRIQPREVVREVRENILISQVARYKDKMVPMASRSFLPLELQRYHQMKELQKQKEKAEQGLKEARKEYDILSASIKTKNIQTISAKNRVQLLASKCNILDLKLESLNKSHEQELKNKAQILATTPVKLNSKNASEKQAAKAVEKALKQLEEFYGMCDDGSSAHILAESKQKLWDQMRSIFGDTPNALLLNVIMKIKEEQLQNIIHLNESTGNSTSSKPPLNNFEVKLLKTKADLLGLAAKSISAQKELEQKESRFCQVYSAFVDELQKKVHTFNGISEEEEENADELIIDFMVQYNMRNFNRAQNEFLREQIEQLRSELEAGGRQLKNHDLMLGSVKQVYSDINSSINRVQQDMVQLSQIKEKILYSRNMMKNMLDNMQAATQNQNAKSQLISTKLKVSNMSMLGAESFCLANDSVFSSTKVEFDCNTSIVNSTLRRSFDNKTMMPGGAGSTTLVSGAGASVPSHLLELNTFAEMSLEKLSCMPRACAFLLAANPLIVEAQELASTVQLAPGYLLTPFGALQEVRKRILWASAIAAHTSDLKLNFEPLIVDPHDLRLKANRQHEEIDQLLDNLLAIGVKTQLQLEKAERIYQFLLANPLRRYVPPGKRFNNGNYVDYESEFNLYYRMATTGGSIRAPTAFGKHSDGHH
ncbi:augmin complex subunit dgt5 [Drosophila bipectinata]|uniref:augmin complex subunit dgt5 n=1 Tax=Drosophila bipectinata TaxID=42026 RepID=UPI001C8ABC81|nr:augmin complex subunit dgt5 [Drosophila bipectinata]